MNLRTPQANARRSPAPKPAATSRWTNVLFRPKSSKSAPKNAGEADDTEGLEAPDLGKETSLSVGYIALVCLVLCVVASAFVYHLKVRFDGIELGYAANAARARQSRLVLERQELRLELASLKAPARVAEEAQEKLGMEIPGHDRIVVIGEKRRSTPVSGGAL